MQGAHPNPKGHGFRGGASVVAGGPAAGFPVAQQLPVGLPSGRGGGGRGGPAAGLGPGVPGAFYGYPPTMPFYVGYYWPPGQGTQWQRHTGMTGMKHEGRQPCRKRKHIEGAGWILY